MRLAYSSERVGDDGSEVVGGKKGEEGTEKDTEDDDEGVEKDNEEEEEEEERSGEEEGGDRQVGEDGTLR